MSNPDYNILNKYSVQISLKHHETNLELLKEVNKDYHEDIISTLMKHYGAEEANNHIKNIEYLMGILAFHFLEENKFVKDWFHYDKQISKLSLFLAPIRGKIPVIKKNPKGQIRVQKRQLNKITLNDNQDNKLSITNRLVLDRISELLSESLSSPPKEIKRNSPSKKKIESLFWKETKSLYNYLRDTLPKKATNISVYDLVAELCAIMKMDVNETKEQSPADFLRGVYSKSTI